MGGKPGGVARRAVRVPSRLSVALARAKAAPQAPP